MPSNGEEQPLTDDQLIARLQQEAQPPRPEHDPFMDLPLAEMVTISGDEVYSGQGPLCGDPARQTTTIQAGYGVSEHSTHQMRACVGASRPPSSRVHADAHSAPLAHVRVAGVLIASSKLCTADITKDLRGPSRGMRLSRDRV